MAFASVGVFSRVMLALVFGTAAATKLVDLGGFGKTLLSFGVPDRLAKSLAPTLVLVEAAITLALVLPFPVSALGLVGAGVVLSAFTAALAVAELRGNRTACFCFGRHSRAAGIGPIIRNFMLVACAVIGAWATLESPQGRFVLAEVPMAIAGIAAGMATVFLWPLLESSYNQLT